MLYYGWRQQCSASCVEFFRWRQDSLPDNFSSSVKQALLVWRRLVLLLCLAHDNAAAKQATLTM